MKIRSFISEIALILLGLLLLHETVFAQWNRAAGIGDRFVYSSISVFDEAVYAGTDSGAYKSTNHGETWFEINNGLGSSPLAVSSFAVCGDRLFAGTYSGLYFSMNKGQSWQLTTLEDPVMSMFAVDPVMLVGVPGGGLYRSPDAGTSWEPISGDRFYSFQFIPNKLFSGTMDGLYVSSDTGLTWTVSGFGEDMVFAIESVNNYLYVSPYGGGVYRTTDQGANWHAASSGLPAGFQANDFYYDGNKLFVCGADNIFLCANPLAINPVWTAVNLDGLSVSPSVIAGIAVSGTNLIVGTEDINTGTGGKGIWRRPLSQIIAVTDNSKQNKPERFSLEQNYPNPFNSSTVIRYYLPEESDVNLKIYNLLGQEIYTLVSARKTAGLHSVEWDGKNSHGQFVGSGFYFYRINAGRHVSTKRMILLK